MKREILITADHSKTLFIPEWNETYHSVHGAAVESQHVFIEQGLNVCLANRELHAPKPLRIFEMGFGTGLNALLTINRVKNTPIYITYETVEKYPLAFEIVEQLNHPENTGLDSLATDFEKMHTGIWGEPFTILPNFSLCKTAGDLHDLELEKGVYDLIYYDAFAPRVQPGLWETAILGRLFDAMSPGAILVTYCAQGQFRRNLKEAGFSVESRPGPPGKREMTVALKRLADNT